MPPKLQKEALLLVLNIGVQRCHKENDPDTLEKIKSISKRIIEKKIFVRPKDEIGIILMGSLVTNNKTETEFVEEYMGFQVANWNIIEEIMSLKGTNNCSNWIETLYSAIEYFEEQCLEGSTRKLIILSDFDEDPDIIKQFEMDKVATDLSDRHIQLLTIGKKQLDEDPISVSEAFLKELLAKVDGRHETMDKALLDLRFYKGAPVKPSAWNCNMQLLDLNIPISAYVKVTDFKTTPGWITCKGDIKVKKVSQYMDRQKHVHGEDEIMKGYQYGETFVAIEKSLEDSMSYKSGPKSYQIHSFAKRDQIKLEYWCNASTRFVVPGKNTATAPFYSLVQAMANTDTIAIVRKVYANNSTPKMVALFPCIDDPDEPWCLVEVELPYAEDRRVMSTRPIKSSIEELSEEQKEAVDKLLDSLMLPDSEDNYTDESMHYFTPGQAPSVNLHHTRNVISYRALNPEKPLPPMEDYLRKLFEVPSIKEKSASHVRNIESLFRLESINPKAKEKAESTAINKQDGGSLEADQSLRTDETTNLETCCDPSEDEESDEFDFDKMAGNP